MSETQGPPQESREVKKVIYTAAFLNNPDELKAKYVPVHPNEFYHHSTIQFMPPDGTSGVEVGKTYNLRITGRVTTGKVDALLVENTKSSNTHPHITLSTAEGIKAFESNTEIENAVAAGTVEELDDFIGVTEGYFDGTQDVTVEDE